VTVLKAKGEGEYNGKRRDVPKEGIPIAKTKEI
jgi:hypothetical protein